MVKNRGLFILLVKSIARQLACDPVRARSACGLSVGRALKRMENHNVAISTNMSRMGDKTVLLARLPLTVILLMWASLGLASDIKVGFVDIPFLIDEAPQSKEASARLEQEFAPRQQDIKTQKQLLAKLRVELDDDDLDLLERSNIERELRKTERRVKRDEQEFREELNIQKNLEFKKVRVYVLDAIASFAKRYEYDLIISDGVLFANKKIDVTDEVLAELTQALTQSKADGGDQLRGN